MGVIRAFFEGEKDLPKIVIKISELHFFYKSDAKK
jgi:hypothetical protein